LAAAGIRNAILIGHSDGGSIATVHAGTAPSAPVMAGRVPGIHALPDTPTLRALITIAAHFFVEDLNIASIHQIRETYETGDLRQRLARYHQNPDIAFHGWNDAWLDPSFRYFDLTPYLPRIQIPILALQGVEDPYGTAEQLHVMEAHVTAPIQTALIPNARHAPHLEAKDATLSLIADFIRKTAA
jgi:pimeloyl-ACP methyl ester carboxylesterase